MLGRKKTNEKSKKPQQADPSSVNIIAKGTSIVGNIESEGTIKFDGKLKGNINAKGKIVVGTTGIIIGNIICNEAMISGKVTGQITVNELLSIKSAATVKGDIITSKLYVEPGAVFNGTCKMNDNANETQANKQQQTQTRKK